MTNSNKFIAILSLVALLIMPALFADTTVSDTDKYSWGANIGWSNWQGDITNGVVYNNTSYLSGYIWSANCGWINVGDGSPANGTAYANNSADDYGINIVGNDGSYSFLMGYAWAPNIGWINFDADMNFEGMYGADARPRIAKSDGILYGMAWGANVGWLSLKSPGIAQVDLGETPVSAGWFMR